MIQAGFTLHDVSRFPIVRLAGRDVPPGSVAAWAAEMEALLGQAEPFALVFLSSAEAETQKDRSARMKWLKAHKAALAERCRAIVSVEPNRAKRVAMRVQGVAVAAAFGLRFLVAPDAAAAEEVARRVLAGETPPEPDES